MTMTTNDLRSLLYDAQEHLNEAINLLSTYVRETDDRNAEAYLVDQLKVHAGRDHGFLSRDLNIDDLLERLDEAEEEEPEDDIDDDNLPDTMTIGKQTLHLLRNDLGPIRNAFGEPVYVALPTD